MSTFENLSFETRWLGRPREHWAELGSTNDRALAWARAGAPHGALVTADAQTTGRGRLGRAWASESGEDLYVSAILRPHAGKPIGALGLAVGVGLREGLASWLPAAQLKWPNDVLVGGRKLGGILCEARWVGSSPEVVVGFGVNVGRSLFPGPLADSATSLRRELETAAPSRDEVLARILPALERALEAFFAGGFAAIRGRYEPHCALVGRTVLVDMANGTGAKVQATALGLADDGALLVREEEGPPRRVESGDVWLAP
ncbi:biotin--[acetyl-CoA-carboxylase] ligase [Nannocystis punicea]|uniref:biotin--[biotin carboxyl-carrier protein] ligase n=1 Tax=Nannocystis punicea TaxID=2995304 RepID=A0ABY7H3J9_9BACT|nr:biotin--[acetyl-CoA-carboxylase] ligase [Nannocystis poenicansa]WAS93604.1 biotin--[acetyl-CoA-carboxylase] ligase [Nannocystis poenicansa]